MKRGRKLSRAQATVFIIIAIVILGGVAISLFAFKNTSSSSGDFSSNPDVQAGFNNIKGSIENCMKYVSEDAIDIIGIHGGYYNPPKDYLDLGWTFMPYYYNNGVVVIPSKEKVEEELGKYFDDSMKICIRQIKEEGFVINHTTSDTIVTISPGIVNFVVDMAVNIGKNTKVLKLELKDNPVTIDSKLYEILGVASYVVEGHKKSELCMDCVSKMTEEKGLFFEGIEFEGNKRIYLISDGDSEEESPYSFEFIVKYKGDANAK